MLDNCGNYIGQIHYSSTGNCDRLQLQCQVYKKQELLPAQHLLNIKIYNQKRVLQRLAAARGKVWKNSEKFKQLQKSCIGKNHSAAYWELKAGQLNNILQPCLNTCLRGVIFPEDAAVLQQIHSMPHYRTVTQ